MGVMRSSDAGLHWSAPVKIAPIRTAQLFVPDDHFPIRAEDYLPDIAIDPTNGDIYVVWSDGLGTPIDKVVMAKSTDGGRHWSGPTVVSTGGPIVQSYNHSIEVTDDGTVVLTYWDDRNNVLGDGVATTDVWLRHSHNGASTWEPEQHLYGPFNQYTAPISYFAPGVPRGLFLGDYMGLETIAGNDVINFFTSTITRRRGRPLDPREPSLTRDSGGAAVGRPRRPEFGRPHSPAGARRHAAGDLGTFPTRCHCRFVPGTDPTAGTRRVVLAPGTDVSSRVPSFGTRARRASSLWCLSPPRQLPCRLPGQAGSRPRASSRCRTGSPSPGAPAA